MSSEQVARKLARAVLALLAAAGIWAGVYAYAVELSRDSLVGLPSCSWARRS